MSLSSRPRVLLADDYPGIISALKRLLQPSCDVVGHVADGAELVMAVALEKPDVVLVDLWLPTLNGLEACQQIRRVSPQAKVIVLSASDDAAIQQKALEVGASAFVPKYRIACELEKAIAGALPTSAPTSPHACRIDGATHSERLTRPSSR